MPVSLMDELKIGLMARADITGLGIQTRDFYRNMNPHKTMVVDLTKCSGRPLDKSWYPGATYLQYTPYPDTPSSRVPDRASKAIIDDFLSDINLFITCETPYDYYILEEAKRRGIKSVIQYNFELLDHVRNPQLPQPDLFMAPSLWRYDDVPFTNKVFVPVPVDRKVFPISDRRPSTVRSWVHVGGNPALEDRNGTNACIEAFKHTPNASLVVRTPARFRSQSANVTVSRGTVGEPSELYDGAEGFIMPRKFGGLCLPLNEAMSIGLPCVMTDLSPQNEFLIRDGLVPANRTKSVFTKTDIDIFEPNIMAMASVINRLTEDTALVERMRNRSLELADKLSWESMRPIYLDTFADLIDDRIPEQRFTWS